jgi:hypothetical protein
MQHKIKKMFALGDLTEAQMDELLRMTEQGASPNGERPETLSMLQTLLGKIEALEVRVKALEEADAPEEPDEPVDPENPDEPVQPIYEAWEPWNGIDNRYQPGAIVTHNGKVWESVYQGQNVWEPGVVGEMFWVEHQSE